jgi:hypothetical protein
VSQSPELSAKLEAAWLDRFDTAADVDATEGDFCGFHMERIDKDTVTMSGDKLINRLEDRLKPFQRPVTMTTLYPMAEDALAKIRAPPSEKNPLMSTSLQYAARGIIGLGGFLSVNARPDALFSFVALSPQGGHNFTKNVWFAVQRWAHYLVDTRHLKMTFRRDKLNRYHMAVDSSVGNAGEGKSFGGYAFGFPESAPIDYE